MKHEFPIPSAALGPEFQLLCLAMRRDASSADLAALSNLIVAQPDWSKIVRGAMRHSVSSHVLAGLQAVATAVPAHVLDALRKRAVQSAGRALAHVDEIGRLTRAFQNVGIPVLVIKGVVLSQQLYDDPSFRSARDIDLLVAPAHFVAAGRLLATEGYRQVGRCYSEREFAVYRRHIKEIEYIHDGQNLNVELHHRLTDNEQLLGCDFHTLWNERDELPLGGAPIPTLPRNLLSLYLCIHGALHIWGRLSWLIDFADSTKAPGAVDAALVQAEKYNVRTAMLHSLALAHAWLGVPVPNTHPLSAGSTLQGRMLNRVLAEKFTTMPWFVAPAPRTWAESLSQCTSRLYVYSLKWEWPYWRSQIARDVISPADWDMVRLPPRLFWCYPLIRPFGWLRRRFRS